MDPRTGAIAQFETDEDARAAGYTEALTQVEFRQANGMTPEARLAWLKERETIKAHLKMLEGNRKARNARKRQRRARNGR